MAAMPAKLLILGEPVSKAEHYVLQRLHRLFSEVLITSRRSLKGPLQRNRARVHFGTSCLQPALLSKSFNHDNCCPSEYVNRDIFIQLQNIFTDHSRLSATMKLVSSKYRTIIQKQPAILQHVLAFGTPSPFKTYVSESFTAPTKRGGSLPYACASVAV